MTADSAVLERVRQVVADAATTGAPVPGRKVLARQLDVSEHQVRKAQAALQQEQRADQTPVEPRPQLVPEPTAQPTADRPGGGLLVAWAGFLFGSITSVAANVLAARIPPAAAGPGWEPSTVAQLGAAVWPLALLLAVEALSRVRWPSGALWRLARYGGAGTVALGSGVISYGHIHAVLGSWGYDGVAAGVGPLVIDGLMVISGFAMLAKSTQGGRR